MQAHRERQTQDWPTRTMNAEFHFRTYSSLCSPFQSAELLAKYADSLLRKARGDAEAEFESKLADLVSDCSAMCFSFLFFVI